MTNAVLPDPSSYLSRHEEIIHQNNNDEMAHETQSNSSTGSQYLQEVLGDALADALSKVAKERPPDPIQYVADYLHGMKPEKDSPSPKKSNISPPRSPNKIASQKIEPDTINEDKNTHQNGILEENGHHSRLDDFKESTKQENPGKIESATERRTTQSEPPMSIAGSISTSNPSSSISNASTAIAEDDFFVASRTNSLDRIDKKKSIKSKKSTSFSRNLPAVAMTKNEYRAKRGLLPPMLQSPKSSPDGEPRINNRNSVTSQKQKPGQLAPLLDSFDMKKHTKRNRKMSNRTTLRL